MSILNLFALLMCLIAGLVLQRQETGVARNFASFLFFMAGTNFSIVMTQVLK